MSTRAGFTIATCLLMALTGCAERSHELRLGDSVLLRTIEPQSSEPLRETPSVTGVDRSDWPAITMLVPVDTIDNQVAGPLPLHEVGAPHRADRLHPAPEASVELGPGESVLSANTLVAPFAAGGDVLSWLYRWPTQTAWTRDGRPLNWRERAPGPTPDAGFEKAEGVRQ